MGSKQTDRQTKIDRKQYNDKTHEKRRKKWKQKTKKHHPVHNFNANSALIIELVEHDNL